jgi:hypothetical protein
MIRRRAKALAAEMLRVEFEGAQRGKRWHPKTGETTTVSSFAATSSLLRLAIVLPAPVRVPWRLDVRHRRRLDARRRWLDPAPF